MDVTKNIILALQYGEGLVGTTYGGWTIQCDMISVDEPFFAWDLPVPVSIKSVSCGGFINLLRRRLSLNIPGTGLYKGGTYSWFETLKKNNLLKDFDLFQSYPAGTLLLRNYDNPVDQGHVAVVYSQGSGGTVQNSKIIHSCTKGVVIDDNLDTFGYDMYYTHVCYPEGWLINML